MNKSFKVVFNKARGALMVVNEVTSSVQAKGTKTVIAAAVATLISSSAIAANTVHPNSALGWDGEQLLITEEAVEGVNGNLTNGVIQINAKNYKSSGTTYGVFTNLYRTTDDVNSDRLSIKAVNIDSSHFEGNESANAGGAMTLWQDGTKDGIVLHHKVSNSVLKANKAASLGGALALLNQNELTNRKGSTTSTKNRYEKNEAKQGGAVYVEASDFISSNDVFEGNKATGGLNQGYGGALFAKNGATLLVENGVFKNNSAWRGGAIANNESTPLIVKNSHFEGNSATGGQYTSTELATGGALFHGKGSFVIENSTFVKNTAEHGGGAISSVFDSKNSVEISNSSFVDNSSLYGGALAVYYGLNIKNSEFNGNHVTGKDDGGGAIVLGGHAKAEIASTTFKNNKANLGGAISTRSANEQDTTQDGHWMHVSSSQFINNVADAGIDNGKAYTTVMTHGDGGAIWNGMTAWNPKNSTEINSITDSTFTGNEAKNNGGAIYNQGNLTIAGSTTFTGNKAKNGGAIYTDANVLTLDATEVHDVIAFNDNVATEKTGSSDLYIGDHTSNDAKMKAPSVELIGNGSILFNGSIGGVESSTLNSNAANVKIADAKNFAGTFNQKAGKTTIAGDKYFAGNVNVTGGTLLIEGEWTATDKTSLNQGTIVTDGKNIFVKGDDQKWATTEGWNKLLEKKGILELTNTGFDYYLDDLKAAQELLNSTDVQLSLNGNLIIKDTDDLTSGNVDGLSVSGVTVDATNNGTATFNKDTTVGGVDFGDNTTAKIEGEGTLTLAGNGGDVFNVSEKAESVTANKLVLGKDENAKGNVNIQKLVANDLTVTGDFTANDVEAKSGIINGVLTADTLTTVNGVTVKGTLALNGKHDKDGKAQAEITGTVTVNGEGNGIGILTTNRAASDRYLTNPDAEENVKNIVYVDRSMTFADGAKVTIGAASPSSAMFVATQANKLAQLTVAKDGQAVIDTSAFVGTKDMVFNNAEVDATAGEIFFVNVNKTGEIQVAHKVEGKVDTDSIYVDAELVENGNKGLVAFAYNKGLLADKTVDARLEDLFAKGASAKEMRILTALDTPEFFDEKKNKFTATGSKAFEQATGGNATAGVFNVAYDANAQVTDAIVRHQLAEKTYMGAWADVFYAKNEAKEMYGNSGYSADIYGGVLGFDATFSCGATGGVAIAMGKADAESEGGVFANKLDSDFWGVSVYTAKDFDGLNVKADLGYMDFSNDFSGLGDASDASTVTFGVRGDYTAYQNGAFSVAPHFGLRYTHIDTDAVAFNDTQTMNVFEAPIGVKFAGTFETTGWKVVPSYDFTIVPQFGDKEVEAFGTTGDVTILNGGLVNNVIGVEASKGNLSFGLNGVYGVGAHDRANTQINANIRYNF